MCSATRPFSTSLDVLKLSRRAYNCLRRVGIDSVERVEAMDDKELLDIPRLGPAVLKEIQEKLAAYLLNHPLSDATDEIESWSTQTTLPSQDATPDEVPLKVLKLSPRPHDVLSQVGITTIDRLTRIPLGQYLTVRKLSRKSRKEIEKKLGKYLAEHPEVLPEPLFPLIDPALLARAGRIPLDQIPLERLALSERQSQRLRLRGIQSIGDLTQQPATILDQTSAVEKRLEQYLTWLVEQDENAWVDEIEGRGISPLHRIHLSETTLEALVADWLSPLKERREQVIRWRYSLDGQRLTLREVGEHMGFTRERARQVQAKGLSILEKSRHRRKVAPLTALVRHLLEQADGLMSASQLDAALRERMTVGDVNPAGVVWLLSKVEKGFKWIRKVQCCGLTRHPLKEVKKVQKHLTKQLTAHKRPLPLPELVTHFTKSSFYAKRQDKLEEPFVVACLRACPDIVIEEEMCISTRWSGLWLDETALALRELAGPTHYAVLAERISPRLSESQPMSARKLRALLQRRPDVFVHIGQGVFGLKDQQKGQSL